MTHCAINVCVSLVLFSCLFYTECLAMLKFPMRFRRAVNVNATSPNLFGSTSSGYYISIEVGTPPQLFNVVVDSGSSNFAIAGAPDEFITRYYDVSKSTTAIKVDSSDISVAYTEGSWKGSVVNDILSIPSAGINTGVLVPMAVIKSSDHFFINGSKWEGILGMAYHELVQPQSLNIPSVMGSIVRASEIEDVFAMQLCSVVDAENTQGSLIIGGSNQSLALGPIEWTRVVQEWYYDVVITGIKVGDREVDVKCTEINDDRTIVDSGTSNLRFPTKVYDAIVQMIKDQVAPHTFPDEFYKSTEMFCTILNIVDIYSWFPNITIFLPSTEFNKTLQIIVFPQNYLQYAEGRDSPCLRFAIFPSTTGTVLGTVVMEQYYTVFNRSAGTVGFGHSSCGNFPADFSASLLLDGYVNSTNCRFIKSTTPSAVRIAAYVLLGLLCLCIIPACYLCIFNNGNGKSCLKNKSHEINDTSGLLPMDE